MPKNEKRDKLRAYIKLKREEYTRLGALDHNGRRHLARLDRIRERIIKARQALARVEGGKPALRASNHAVLRYLERVKGVDVEAATAEMLTDAMDFQAIKYGRGEFPAADGSYYLNVRDFIVVTCYEKLRPITHRKSKPTDGKNRKGR